MGCRGPLDHGRAATFIGSTHSCKQIGTATFIGSTHSCKQFGKAFARKYSKQNLFQCSRIRRLW